MECSERLREILAAEERLTSDRPSVRTCFLGCCSANSFLPPSPRCLPMNCFRLLTFLSLISAISNPAVGQTITDSAAEAFFNREIQPILAENCFACHGFDKKSRQADLRLDTFDDATADRDGHKAIAPGIPSASLIMERINSTDHDLMMPPPETGKQLSAAQKESLNKWITEGAKYGRHWSFIAPVQVEPPMIDGVDHPIDRFIQARLKKSAIPPSPKAPLTVLVRRVSLDLIGLPPTVEEIDTFLAESAVNEQQAWNTLVDRLLSSPHYGERWGRWWLDQARYADSNGYSIDAPREIWKYRDWVVEALNANMPFDQFTIEQLAGDLLPNATASQKVATGFHRNTQINQEGGIDREQFRIDSVFDRVATTGTVWLGLTIGCAQCHDHKFDPIEQKEYYRLFAFLNNQDEPTMKVYDHGIDGAKLTAEQKQLEGQISKILTEQSEAIAAWESALDVEARRALPGDVRKALDAVVEKRSFAQKLLVAAASPVSSNESFAALQKRHAEVTAILGSAPTTMVLKELPQPRKTTVFINGDFTRPDEEVTPGTPSVLHAFENSASQPNRLDLAHWIVSPQNPLTARVITNRLWQQYFGRGLVETENDFGTLGSRPTHPELLDWLACELMQRQWNLKHMHRLIVTSATYQQSSNDRDDLRDVDPRNDLLARQQRLRLDGELVRDVALTASGLLSRKMNGPPVYPPIPDGAMNLGQANRAWKASTGEDRYRRGLYTFLYRATPPPSLNVFDVPDGYSTCTRRNRSNTPLQSLTLMNDAAFVEFAQALEKIIQTDGLETAFRRCTGRLPNGDEKAVLERLDRFTAARVLLNLDETITRE